MEEIREECGVFGIWSNPGTSVSQSIYYGLMALQHRGQESAGIATTDTTGERGNLCIHKDMGLVTEVFHKECLVSLKGNIGIGHVRYSTTGGSNIQNAQPVTFQYLKGSLSLVHNGNIVNAEELKEQLLKEGSVFSATSDSEVIATLIARLRAGSESIEEAVAKAAKQLFGGYALILMSPRKLVAVRDPLGIKPLCIGRLPEGYVISSESCALNAVGAELIRDVQPGEIVVLDKDGIRSDRHLCPEKQERAHCIFEYIYFARLDSVMDGVSIYEARIRGGMTLAKAHPAMADVVTGVPESGITAAIGYAKEAGIPFVHAFYKNSYIGRTFIKPTQSERETAVHMKLSIIPGVIKDKRVVLIDDSIVRGTTIAGLISMLRKAGAVEVHVRISSPPFLYPCYYGTDVPDNSALIATHMPLQKIKEQIGADSLGYMRLEDLQEMTGNLGLCKACFDGAYPHCRAELAEEKMK